MRFMLKKNLPHTRNRYLLFLRRGYFLPQRLFHKKLFPAFFVCSSKELLIVDFLAEMFSKERLRECRNLKRIQREFQLTNGPAKQAEKSQYKQANANCGFLPQMR